MVLPKCSVIVNRALYEGQGPEAKPPQILPQRCAKVTVLHFEDGINVTTEAVCLNSLDNHKRRTLIVMKEVLFNCSIHVHV